MDDSTFLSCTHPGCKQKFESSTDLSEHLRTHSNEKSIVCTHENCGQGFAHLATLIIHSAQKHQGDNPFRCPQWSCPAVFSNPSLLTEHMKEHEGEVYECDAPKCRAGFATMLALDHHKRSHKELWGYVCCVQDCDTALRSLDALEAHARQHHDKGYKCVHPGCGASFTQANPLARHRRKYHPFDTPLRFRCRVENCGEEFYSVHTLEEHMHLRHISVMFTRAEEIFLCSFADCLYTFSDIDELAMHLDEHEWKDTSEEEDSSEVREMTSARGRPAPTKRGRRMEASRKLPAGYNSTNSP